MNRRKFSKFVIFTPILLLIDKVFPKSIKAKEDKFDSIFNSVKGNNKSAISFFISFKDKNDKIVHYGRLTSLDPKYGAVEDISDNMFGFDKAGSILRTAERTYTWKVKDKLKKEFDFF